VKNVEYNKSSNAKESIYSQRLRAGKRRTYFFDVRATKGEDYYITITESKKRFDDDGYDRHKVFIYKEDFNKFITALSNTVDHVKTELMPEYDFDEFTRDPEEFRRPPAHATEDELKAETFQAQPSRLASDDVGF